MAWTGWGAGPAGAGSTGGPSRVFLALVLAGAIAAVVFLARDGNAWGAVIAALCAGYFALRLFGRIGR